MYLYALYPIGVNRIVSDHIICLKPIDLHSLSDLEEAMKEERKLSRTPVSVRRWSSSSTTARPDCPPPSLSTPSIMRGIANWRSPPLTLTHSHSPCLTSPLLTVTRKIWKPYGKTLVDIRDLWTLIKPHPLIRSSLRLRHDGHSLCMRTMRVGTMVKVGRVGGEHTSSQASPLWHNSQ